MPYEPLGFLWYIHDDGEMKKYYSSAKNDSYWALVINRLWKAIQHINYIVTILCIYIQLFIYHQISVIQLGILYHTLYRLASIIP